MNIEISNADIESLESAIRDNVGTSTQAVEAQGVSAADFCKLWPQVKQGLELLRKILELVPGVGPFAKAAISIVIAAGDAASNALCR